jgi:hypothetical protein
MPGERRGLHGHPGVQWRRLQDRLHLGGVLGSPWAQRTLFTCRLCRLADVRARLEAGTLGGQGLLEPMTSVSSRL